MVRYWQRKEAGGRIGRNFQESLMDFSELRRSFASEQREDGDLSVIQNQTFSRLLARGLITPAGSKSKV